MKILIVDNEESITEIFQLLLEEEGYTVDTASSGQEALSLAESHYDLVRARAAQRARRVNLLFPFHDI